MLDEGFIRQPFRHVYFQHITIQHAASTVSFSGSGRLALSDPRRVLLSQVHVSLQVAPMRSTRIQNALIH
jgi:hypothetical protein